MEEEPSMQWNRRAAWTCAAALAGAGMPALAQNYPNKPIRIVTQSIGGGIDFTARLLAYGLTERLGQQIVVDNRGGPNIAPLTVAKANPDGYTLLVHNNTVWVSPLLEDVPYDHEKELAPITLTSRSPNILVVHPSLGVNTVKELIARAKAAPGEINYASGPIGASNHLAAELFKAAAGVNLTRVGYKGGGPALNDMLAGQVKVMFATTGSVTGHIKSGKLRALGVTSAQPSPLVPGMPTIASLGVPGYAAEAIYGFWAPAKTPAAVIARLNQEAVRVVQSPEIKERFFASGVEAVGSTPAQFAAEIKAESTRLAQVIKSSGMRAQ
jgi:tripartite-type tricarboxylate transporter receptor subunit TctC